MIDNDEIIKKIVEIYLDTNINSSHPYEEWFNDDIIIMSKYDFGRLIIVENFEDDDDVHIDKIYDLVEFYLNDLVCGVLNGAVEYCCNNDYNIHM